MTLRTATLNGQKPRNFRVGKEAAFKDRTQLLSSARKAFKRPNLMPTDAKEIDELGFQLLEWVQQEEAISLDQFFAKRMMSPSRFIRLCETHEMLANCLDVALATISSRLQEGLKNNQLYLMNKERQYSIMSREEARLKREADKDTQVTKIYEIENVQIPVFTRKDKE